MAVPAGAYSVPEKRLRIEAKGMKLAAKQLAIRLTFQQDRDHRSTMDATHDANIFGRQLAPTTYYSYLPSTYYF